MLQDPLLSSIFKQIQSLSFDADTFELTVSFSKDLIFFNEWLENTAVSWKPLFQKIFGENAQCKILFVDEPKAQGQQNFNSGSQAPSAKPTVIARPQESFVPQAPRRQLSKNSSSIDISDVSVWKNAPLVMEYFPGTLQEVKESHHE
jgi:hypothetical protein